MDERALTVLLAAVVLSYLAVGLAGVAGCLWASHACAHVDWRFWFGEPLAALLGLMGGRAIERQRKQ